MKNDTAACLSGGRVRQGQYATTDADGLQGTFFVRCQLTGRMLRILASDGRDWQEADLPGPAWEHVSVSLAEDDRRTPCWAEMCWAKGLFWRDQETVVQFHPPKSSYVNTHAGCLHLWKPVGVEIPIPPQVCV